MDLRRHFHIFAILILSACTARADAPAGFPWLFTPETAVPGYLQFRAEGLSLKDASAHAVAYVRKWKDKKFTAPAEEVSYFDAQRALLRYLRHAAPPPGAPLELGMVGDVMWVRNQWSRFVAPDVLAHLEQNAVLLGNLESPIARSMPVPSLMPDCRAYNSDPALVRSFRDAGGRNLFTALATANNHMLDMGDAGAAETLAFLDEEGIAHSGTAKKGGARWASFERGGIKFGFYAASWGLNDPASLETTGMQLNVVRGLAPERQAPADLEEVRRALDEMRAAGCAFRIVAMHWGFEYEYYPSPRVMQEGHRIVELGADLVMGGHSHVQQPPEVCLLNGYEKAYAEDSAAAGLAALAPGSGCLLATPDGRPRKALIVYSLGNFTTTMMSDITRVAWMPGITLARDPVTGAIDWTGVRSSWAYNKVPTLTSRSRALTMLDREPTPYPELNAPWLGTDGALTPLAFLKRHVGAE